MKTYEIFESIQGEGSMVGTPCTFVRTPGCNKDCYFCDTDWKQKGEHLDVNWLPSREVQWIWVTGGEPLLQKDLSDYVTRWRYKGFKVAVETNGTIPLPCHFDHVVVSPKCGWEELRIYEADDLKVVVPAFNTSEYCGFKAKNKFVQPEFGSEIPKVPFGWKISLQNHKYWGLR